MHCRRRPTAPAPRCSLPSATGTSYRELLDTRQPYRDFELLHRAADGTLRHLFLSGTPLFDALGGWRGYTGVASDRSAERRAERLLRMEHGVTRGLADASTVAHGLALALRALCEHEGWACGEYWVVDAAAQVLRFGGRWDRLPAATRALFEDAERFEFAPGVGLAGRVWQTRQPLWVADVSTDVRMLRKELAREAGLKGALLFPTLAAGEVCGVFAFWSQAIRRPDERLLQAIRVIGSQVGQFVLRKQAEGVLRASESRFRALTALSSDWYWEQDGEAATRASRAVPPMRWTTGSASAPRTWASRLKLALQAAKRSWHSTCPFATWCCSASLAASTWR